MCRTHWEWQLMEQRLRKHFWVCPRKWTHPFRVTNQEKFVKKLLSVYLKAMTRRKKRRNTRSLGLGNRLIVKIHSCQLQEFLRFFFCVRTAINVAVWCSYWLLLFVLSIKALKDYKFLQKCVLEKYYLKNIIKFSTKFYFLISISKN